MVRNYAALRSSEREKEDRKMATISENAKVFLNQKVSVELDKIEVFQLCYMLHHSGDGEAIKLKEKLEKYISDENGRIDVRNMIM